MKRPTKLLAFTLSAGLLLAGCGDAPERSGSTTPDGTEFSNAVPLADDIDPNGHFDWGYTSFPPGWDPIDSTNGADINFYEPVYDRLLREDADGTITPMLATSFEASSDNSTLTLTLREELTFSDGTPFDADAVKFSLDRARGEESKIAADLYQIDSVEVVDPTTVQIHVSGGMGPLVVALANRAGIVVSPTAAEAGLLQSEPIGVGPYVVTSTIPGSKAEFSRTDGYWDAEAQNVATMTYHHMPDDQTRINALRTGELDGARVNPDQMGSLASDGIIPLVEPSSAFIYLVVNTSKASFDNAEVRKALNMAIDRETISQGLYDGYCTPQIQPFQSTSPGYSDKIGDGLDIFPYDPEAAKEILEDAGVTDLSITTVTPNVTIYTKLSEVLQSQLADVGVDMTIMPLPPNEIVQVLTIDQTVDALATIGTGINDPDVTNSRYITESSLFNPGKMAYPELLEHGAAGAASMDPAERKAAYEQYMDSWVENPPHLIPICMIHQAVAVNDNVSGVTQRANGYPDMRYMGVGQD